MKHIEMQDIYFKVKLREYSKRLADFVIAHVSGNVPLQHETCGLVTVFINNNFQTVAKLSEQLAKSAGGSLIYELWSANYTDAILGYRNKLSSMEFEALVTYAGINGAFEVTAKELDDAVRCASLDLYGELEESF